MKVHIQNPERHVEVASPRKVAELLAELCRARAQILDERLQPPADEQVSREISEEVLPVEVYGGRPGAA